MASWLTNLPWKNDPTYDLVDFFSGAARISRLACASGYEARAFDINYDSPPMGTSSHSGRARRSAFDINGEGGFLPLKSKLERFVLIGNDDEIVFFERSHSSLFYSVNHLTHFQQALSNRPPKFSRSSTGLREGVNPPNFHLFSWG